MHKEYTLGTFFGLRFSTMPSAVIVTGLMWLGVSVIAMTWLNFSPIEAIVAAFVAVALHWFSEISHQLGHAFMARRAGYPMHGLRGWGALSTSLYPPDEPTLPGAIHIRRAIGGPVVSFGFALCAAIIFVTLDAMNVRGALWYLALFCVLENLLVFCLGAFLPLGFTDGSTILEWWGK